MSFNRWEALAAHARRQSLYAYVIAHHEGRPFSWFPRQLGDPPPSHHFER